MPDYLKISLLNNRFPALHGLRVFAILGVIAVHVNMLGFETHPQFYSGNLLFIKNLWFSMDFFFVLSGFLIGYLLLHQIPVTGLRGFGRFYLRRSFRVFPLYYFVLFTLFFFARPTDYSFSKLLHEIFYITNYPFSESYLMVWSWSLSLEEHFYLTAPLFIFIWLKLPGHTFKILSLVALWALCLYLKILTLDGMDFSQVAKNREYFLAKLYTPSHLRFDAFAIGILLAYVNTHFKNKIHSFFNHRILRWTALSIVSSIYLWILLSHHSFPVLSRKPAFLFLIQMGTTASLAHGILILYCIHHKSYLTKLLSHHVMAYGAAIGYGIYLVHFPIMQALLSFESIYLKLSSATLSWFFIFTTTTLLSILLAYGLHLLIEKPALLIRDRLSETNL